jgi:quinol monooxygenase YgiN
MNPQAITVFAKWQVKEGELENVLKLVAELGQKSRAEEGNLFYEVHQSNADANTLLLYEGYRDDAAAAAHRESAHFQQIVPLQIVPLLQNREVIPARQII